MRKDVAHKLAQRKPECCTARRRAWMLHVRKGEGKKRGVTHEHEVAANQSNHDNKITRQMLSSSDRLLLSFSIQSNLYLPALPVHLTTAPSPSSAASPLPASPPRGRRRVCLACRPRRRAPEGRGALRKWRNERVIMGNDPTFNTTKRGAEGRRRHNLRPFLAPFHFLKPASPLTASTPASSPSMRLASANAPRDCFKNVPENERRACM